MPIKITIFQKWAEFIRTVDPDLITGYNIQNFDFPYIIERAKALRVRIYSPLPIANSFRHCITASN